MSQDIKHDAPFQVWRWAQKGGNYANEPSRRWAHIHVLWKQFYMEIDAVYDESSKAYKIHQSLFWGKIRLDHEDWNGLPQYTGDYHIEFSEMIPRNDFDLESFCNHPEISLKCIMMALIKLFRAKYGIDPQQIPKDPQNRRERLPADRWAEITKNFPKP